MKLLNWTRFTWDLKTLPPFDLSLPEHYQMAIATPEDEFELRKVFSSSFLLDPAWNGAVGEVMQTINDWLQRAFVPDSKCLALRHGSRIIGAAVLSLDPLAENHLAPGPCVLTEYRNRGFGTRLLEHSLEALRAANLPQAAGITCEIAPVAKFLYPKFCGAASAIAVARPLAA